MAKITINPELQAKLKAIYDEHTIPVLVSGGLLSGLIAFLTIRSFLKKEKAKKKETVMMALKHGFKLFIMFATSSSSLSYLKKADALKNIIDVE